MKQPKAELPAVAIGHVTLRVADPLLSAAFYEGLGLREILKRAEIAILELRGGTHLILFRAKRKPKALCPQMAQSIENVNHVNG